MTEQINRSVAAAISNNVLADRLNTRIQQLAETAPELFITREEAEAVGYSDNDVRSQQEIAEEDAEAELLLAAEEV